MAALALLCPHCASALPPRVIELVGLFMLAPFAVAAIVIVTVVRAGRREDG